MPDPTAAELLRAGARTLRASSSKLARTGDEEDQASELLEHVLGRKPAKRERVGAKERRRFEALIERRATGEPLPHIVGWIDFKDLRFPVRPGVFIPRPSSEFMATEAIRRLSNARPTVHVDLATGIGPVALSAASARPRAEVHGVDISDAAVRMARANAKRFGLKARFHTGDLFDPLPRRLRGRVDVITIHPPYVPRRDVRHLPDEILRFEPQHVLTDGSVDGYGLARRVAEEAPDWLRPNGWVLVECDASAARGMKSLFRGFRDVRSLVDVPQLTRVIVARCPV